MEAAADRLLDAIERLELRSLVWGDVDGSLSEREVLELAKKVVGAELAEDAVEDLLDARLIFAFPSPSGGATGRVRSRFAELTRLLVRLRQIFPGEDWRGAPRLVSDFRVDIRPRRFPKRDVDPRALGEALVAEGRLSGFQKELWDAMTASLPGLSGFQARSISRVLEPSGDSGAIVTAGTGSGKTLAFYLPAFLRIGPKVRAGEFWTKAIAVYPRRELLKDQLTEAVRRAETVAGVLSKGGRRPLVVGAFYGEMPNAVTADDDELKRKGWRVQRDGVVCPVLRCPKPDCGAELVWPKADRDRHRERLVCTRAKCGFETSGDVFPMTRKSVRQRPPDVLFTTTETLNTRMSDGWSRRLFGLGERTSRHPDLMLLDEVHTYTGATGAQVALLLRRWRKLLGSPVAFVGLSATLEEAPRFFHELCGIPFEKTVEITPNQGEMEEAAAEYQLALRGDPVSQTALLSTSIQSAMLLCRMLDKEATGPDGRGMSEGRFGRRLFVFTDDLDVTHRLYDDLHDAEAYTRFRKPDPGSEPLAALRSTRAAEDVERNMDGQFWRAAEQLGHNLGNRLIIGRTTSRDPGVAERANVIVATASLEVGFNDPTVGAVLQHKAPHNPAAFVQRRGRAGRPREMRPVTVTVLSDYGRDRRAFQGYEHLFDPRLPPQGLPIRNQYVLRMQAAFAFIDWLFEQCPENEQSSWLYPLLASPRVEDKAEAPASKAVRIHVQRALTRLVRGDRETVGSLRSFLAESLGLEPEEADVVLWQPPRSILLEVAPTLTRRLFRNWRNAFPNERGEWDSYVGWHPLPEFLPANLFSDLNLPEVQILVPAASSWREEKQESLPVASALGQLAPGRVTRRFADEYGGLAHWVPVDLDADIMDLPIDDYAKGNEYVGHFRSVLAQPGKALPVFRPLEIELQQVTRMQALPTSQGRFLWESGFEPCGTPLEIDIPEQSAWSHLISRVSFWLHRRQTNVLVRRFAPKAVANVRRLGQDEAIVDVRLVDGRGEPAAVGFEIAVDGCCVELQLPPVTDLAKRVLPPGLTAATRTAFFRDLVKRDGCLPRDVNVFQREWLQQIFLSAAVLRAEGEHCALSEAVNRLRTEGAIQPFDEVMDRIFAIQEAQAAVADTEEEVETDEEGRADEGGRHPRNRIGKLKKRLRELLDQPAVLHRLADNLKRAITCDGEDWGRWLAETTAETLAQSLYEAGTAAAPQQASLDTLVVDREGGAENVKLWLTESTLGGAGVVEALAERFIGQPGRFLQAIEAALSPGDLELAAIGLSRIVALAVADDVIADQLGKMRQAESHAERMEARERLSSALAERGVLMGHALAVAMSSRLLRVGTSADTDRLLFDLLTRWETLETRHGVAVGLREYAYIAAVYQSDVGDRLRDLGLIESSRPASRVVQILAGLLWPRGPEIRQRALQSYNAYREAQYVDAALARALLFMEPPVMVSLDDPNWRETLGATLASDGAARLSAAPGRENEMRAAILETIATPIAVGPLHLFSAVERVEQDGDGRVATFVLREVTGW